MFTQMFNEKVDLSAEFAKVTGLKKDSKKMGKGDVYFLKDGSSIVIGAEKGRIQYYSSDMDYITSYNTVKQATNNLKQSGLINEAKMSDDDISDACNTIIKNGDNKAKEFAQGMMDYYKEKGSFHPNQVSGLQNIMKNASHQMAEATGTNDLLIKIKDAYYGISDSDAKGIVVYLNNLDWEEAKKLKIDVKKESKIWSKVAELVSSSNLGKVL